MSYSPAAHARLPEPAVVVLAHGSPLPLPRRGRRCLAARAVAHPGPPRAGSSLVLVGGWDSHGSARGGSGRGRRCRGRAAWLPTARRWRAASGRGRRLRGEQAGAPGRRREEEGWGAAYPTTASGGGPRADRSARVGFGPPDGPPRRPDPASTRRGSLPPLLRPDPRRAASPAAAWRASSTVGRRIDGHDFFSRRGTTTSQGMALARTRFRV